MYIECAVTNIAQSMDYKCLGHSSFLISALQLHYTVLVLWLSGPAFVQLQDILTEAWNDGYRARIDKAANKMHWSDVDHHRIVTSSTCGRIMKVLGVLPEICSADI